MAAAIIASVASTSVSTKSVRDSPTSILRFYSLCTPPQTSTSASKAATPTINQMRKESKGERDYTKQGKKEREARNIEQARSSDKQVSKTRGWVDIILNRHLGRFRNEHPVNCSDVRGKQVKPRKEAKEVLKKKKRAEAKRNEECKKAAERKAKRRMKERCADRRNLREGEKVARKMREAKKTSRKGEEWAMSVNEKERQKDDERYQKIRKRLVREGGRDYLGNEWELPTRDGTAQCIRGGGRGLWGRLKYHFR
jgi:hypothetical protein